MTFLLGRQATFGQEPPTSARSTTTVFWPWLARVQARILPATPLPMIRFRTCSVLMVMLRIVVKGSCRGPLARLPGLAERPERDPKQGQVLEQELPRFPREGGEAAGARLPDARRRDEEAQGREEHPDGQGTAEGGRTGRERARGDEDRDGDLNDAEHGREAPDAQEPVDPTHQGAVGDVQSDSLGLVSRELHEADPPHHNYQGVASQLATDRLNPGAHRPLLVGSILHQGRHLSLLSLLEAQSRLIAGTLADKDPGRRQGLCRSPISTLVIARLFGAAALESTSQQLRSRHQDPGGGSCPGR